MNPRTEKGTDDRELSELLEEMRAEAERLQAQAKESTELRLKWERQRTTDRELIRKLDSALAGEITWLDVMSSREYREAHQAEFDNAIEDYERREVEGTLPDPDEAQSHLSEFMDTLRSDVAAAEQADAAAAEAGRPGEAEQPAGGEQQRVAESPFVPPADEVFALGTEPALSAGFDDMSRSLTPPGEYRDESPFLHSTDEDVPPAPGLLTGDAADQ